MIVSIVLGLSCLRAPGPDRDGIDARASVAALRGRVFHSRPAAIRLAEGWSVRPDGAGWMLTVPGKISVDVTDQLDARSAITIGFDVESRRSVELRALWDGVELPTGAVSSDHGRTVITVPPGSVAPGDHDVLLRRADDIDSDPLMRQSFEVTRITFAVGDETTDLDPKRLERDHLLVRFESLGVLPGPDGRVHSGGFVFDGPGTVRCTASPPRGGLLRVTADNRSSAAAVFTVSNSGVHHRVEVAAASQEPFEIPLPEGASELEFTVVGDDDGVFFWARPRVVQDAAARLTPIIIITIDTTRRDVIPPYTDRRELAPHIARFSDRATVYDLAWATAPWTLPSHASIFTGLVPTRHGAGVSGSTLEPRFDTLAELLANRGWLAAGMAGGSMCAANRGLAQGFSSYRDPDSAETPADRMTDRAIAWLESLDGEAPFLFVNYFDPHYPYHAPEAFQGPARRPLTLPSGEPMTIGHLNRTAAKHGVLPPEIRRPLVAAYQAEVRFMDHEIGRLLVALERLGLFERAFIAIVSDHGEMLGEHGYLFHSFRLDPELVHIPFLVKWPDQSHRETVTAPVSLVDLFPTVLEIAGVGPVGSDGRALPRADGEGRAPTATVLAEEHRQLELNPLSPQHKKIADHLWATASADQLTVVWDGGAMCLDLSGSQWRPSPCSSERTESAWSTVHQVGEPPDTGRPGSFRLTDDERKRLEALGYLDGPVTPAR
jgi:hypothetical protein